MNDQLTLPGERFTVLYRGAPIEFQRVDYGWAYLCPAGCCRAFHWIMTDRHPDPMYNNPDKKLHVITSAPGDPVTVQGSLGCPCMGHGRKCAWHVVITDGVAKDA